MADSTTTNDTNLLDLTTAQQGGDLKPSIDPESSDTLDRLFAEATTPAADETTPAAKPVVEAAPVADETPAAPVVEEASAAEEAPAPLSDNLDSVELPPYSKPKSVEAFAQVKSLARERIAAAERERDALKAEIAELQANAKPGLAPEIETELNELREFRQKLDVEAHPSFKAWDKQVTDNVASIYSKLRAAGVAEDSIKKIEDMGGPSEVDWEPLSAKLPQSLKRYIEGKLFENEDVSEKRNAAMADAKKNSAEFLKTRSEELGVNEAKFEADTRKTYESFIPQLEWMNEKKAAANATPEEKASVEAHNALVRSTKAEVDGVLKDASPTGRAILAVGYTQLQKVRSDHAALVKASQVISTKHALEVAELKKTVAAKDAFIAKIKKASGGGLDSAAPPAGDRPAVVKQDLYSNPSDTLDRLRAEAEAARE